MDKVVSEEEGPAQPLKKRRRRLVVVETERRKARVSV